MREGRENKEVGLDKMIIKKNFTELIKEKPELVVCGSRYDHCTIYTVPTVNALSQVIGWIKFNNPGKNVLYRGATRLYPDISPALFRGLSTEKKQTRISNNINKLLKEIIDDKKMSKSLKLKDISNKSARKIVVEALLQHYGIRTRCLDVVDNHWIALWFGLNEYTEKKVHMYKYGEFEPRISQLDGKPTTPLYQYIYVFVINKEIDLRDKDKEIDSDFKGIVAVDLRKAIPSMYVRPHAQHAWIIRSTEDTMVGVQPNFLDCLFCIIKLNSFQVMQWLGNGTLVSQRNLFPPPQYDIGYYNILSRTDIFDKYKNQIIRYTP